MRFNLKQYIKTIQYTFLKSEGTPGRLSPKRLLIVCLIFLFYPLWQITIRTAYLLDNLFYPDHLDQEVKAPIFIVGNFRSGTTFLHRLLTKDGSSTSLRSWEIYLAPSVVGRKLFRRLMRLNYSIGNPVQKAIEFFNRVVEKEAYMHKIGLTEPEEDSQVLFHIWSSYNLLAFFPFPKLIRKYIYYDDQTSVEEKTNDMNYYTEIVKKHIYSHNGKRLISKNPTYSPKVKTLHERFPDAKFINIVRNPLQVIPSTISMYSKHCKNYGDPKTEYSLQETVIEHSKHWYVYPHRYLIQLPPDQYIRIHYKDLVRDPQGTIERIYRKLNLKLTPTYARILRLESEKAKSYKSSHKYSLRKMGISRKRISREFETIVRQLNFENPE